MIEIIIGVLERIFTTDNVDKAVKYFSGTDEKIPLKQSSLKIKVKKEEEERLGLIALAIIDKMKDHGYSVKKTEAFRAVFTELSANAFRHGCDLDGKVFIKLHLNRHSLICRIYNSPGRRHKINLADYMFNPGKIIQTTAGRGILMSLDQADSINIDDDYSVKFTIEQQEVKYELEKCELDDGYAIDLVKVLDGINSGKFSKVIKNDVIIDPLDINRFYVIDIRTWESVTDQSESEESINTNSSTPLNEDRSKTTSGQIFRMPASATVRQMMMVQNLRNEKPGKYLFGLNEGNCIILTNNRKLVTFYGKELVSDKVQDIVSRVQEKWFLYLYGDEKLGLGSQGRGELMVSTHRKLERFFRSV